MRFRVFEEEEEEQSEGKNMVGVVEVAGGIMFREGFMGLGQ